VGVRHALFPRSLIIWRPTSPVECRWLSASRRCAGLQGRLQAVTAPQRSRSPVSPQMTFWMRLLSPEFTHMQRASTGPGSDASENGCIRSTSAGSASDHSVSIVGPAPRVLSLTPQVAFTFSIGRSRFRHLPHFGSYCDFRGHHRSPGAFQSDHSIRDDSFPFRVPAAKPEPFGGILFVRNRREENHHTGSQ
jgi:hypothetical protein